MSASVTASYGYDPLGRRYQKTVNGTVTSYLSAGDELIADYDSAGNLTYRYVPGAGTDQPIARITSGGTIEYVHADRQGSVIALANDTGTLSAGPYSYSSFGAGGSLSGVEFQYTGRQIDPETGLYYYRARYYSPTLGRFLQTDPVGYADNINWYAYVGNDPVNATDPSGKKPGDPFITAEAAGLDAVRSTNATSIKTNKEIGGYITIHDNGMYYATINNGTEGSVKNEITIDVSKISGLWHDHANYSDAYGAVIGDKLFDNVNSDQFSSTDLNNANNLKISSGNVDFISVLGTPSGAIKVYKPSDDTLKTIVGSGKNAGIVVTHCVKDLYTGLCTGT